MPTSVAVRTVRRRFGILALLAALLAALLPVPAAWAQTEVWGTAWPERLLPTDEQGTDWEFVLVDVYAEVDWDDPAQISAALDGFDLVPTAPSVVDAQPGRVTVRVATMPEGQGSLELSGPGGVSVSAWLRSQPLDPAQEWLALQALDEPAWGDTGFTLLGQDAVFAVPPHVEVLASTGDGAVPLAVEVAQIDPGRVEVQLLAEAGLRHQLVEVRMVAPLVADPQQPDPVQELQGELWLSLEAPTIAAAPRTVYVGDGRPPTTLAVSTTGLDLTATPPSVALEDPEDGGAIVEGALTAPTVTSASTFEVVVDGSGLTPDQAYELVVTAGFDELREWLWVTAPYLYVSPEEVPRGFDTGEVAHWFFASAGGYGWDESSTVGLVDDAGQPVAVTIERTPEWESFLPDDDVADLAWDVRAGADSPLPVGHYRWQVTTGEQVDELPLHVRAPALEVRPANIYWFDDDEEPDPGDECSGTGNLWPWCAALLLTDATFTDPPQVTVTERDGTPVPATATLDDVGGDTSATLRLDPRPPQGTLTVTVTTSGGEEVSTRVHAGSNHLTVSPEDVDTETTQLVLDLAGGDLREPLTLVVERAPLAGDDPWPDVSDSFGVPRVVEGPDGFPDRVELDVLEPLEVGLHLVSLQDGRIRLNGSFWVEAPSGGDPGGPGDPGDEPEMYVTTGVVPPGQSGVLVGLEGIDTSFNADPVAGPLTQVEVLAVETTGEGDDAVSTWVPVAGAVTDLEVAGPTQLLFTLGVGLDEGVHLVRATTGDEVVDAFLSVFAMPAEAFAAVTPWTFRPGALPATTRLVAPGVDLSDPDIVVTLLRAGTTAEAGLEVLERTEAHIDLRLPAGLAVDWYLVEVAGPGIDVEPAWLQVVEPTVTLSRTRLSADRSADVTIGADGRNTSWAQDATTVDLLGPGGEVVASGLAATVDWASQLRFTVPPSLELTTGSHTVRITTPLAGETDEVVQATLWVAPPRTDEDPLVTTNQGTVDPETGEVTITSIWGSVTPLTLGGTTDCAGGAAPDTVQVTIGSVARTATVDGATWSVTFSEHDLTASGGGTIVVTVTCPGEQPVSEPVGQFVLYDPSGYVTDAATGEPVAGATVTLFEIDGWEPHTSPADIGQPETCESNASRPEDAPWSQQVAADDGEQVPADSPRIRLIADPDNTHEKNPTTTDEAGWYGWDVAHGCWYVIVAKEGYETLVSPVVGVGEDPIGEVTDLDLELIPSSVGDPVDPDPPSFPEGAELTVDDVSFDRVDLRWPAAGGEVPLGGYELAVTGGGDEWVLPLDADATSTRVGGLQPATHYTFTLVAIDEEEQRSDALEADATTTERPGGGRGGGPGQSPGTPPTSPPGGGGPPSSPPGRPGGGGPPSSPPGRSGGVW
jgi:hypothetical protein